MDLNAARAAVEIEPEWSGDDSPPLNPHARYRANEGIPTLSRRRAAGAWEEEKTLVICCSFRGNGSLPHQRGSRCAWMRRYVLANIAV